MNRISSPVPVGTMIRDWRQRRHLSQLDLAVEANISTRHLSFLETGRSQPSREMVGSRGILRMRPQARATGAERVRQQQLRIECFEPPRRFLQQRLHGEIARHGL
jgi:hypothetical protein